MSQMISDFFSTKVLAGSHIQTIGYSPYRSGQAQPFSINIQHLLNFYLFKYSACQYGDSLHFNHCFDSK